jgi:hypothetical protein
MVKYSIDKKNQVTYAQFCDDWCESLIAMLENIHLTGSYYTQRSIVEKVLNTIPHKYAKTRLRHGDEYSEEKGKEIARKKLFDKFNRAKERVLREYRKAVVRECNVVFARIDRKLR